MELRWDILVVSFSILIAFVGFRRVLRYFNENAIEEHKEIAIEADKRAEERRRHIATIYAAVRKSHENALRLNKNPREDIRSVLAFLKSPADQNRLVEHAQQQGNSELTQEILRILRPQCTAHRAYTNE